MKHIPDTIDVRNFIGEKFDCVECDGNAQDPRMRENLKRKGQMNHPEALKETESSNRGVEIQAGRESRAERKAESFDRIHDGSLTPCTRSGRRPKAGDYRAPAARSCSFIPAQLWRVDSSGVPAPRQWVSRLTA